MKRFCACILILVLFLPGCQSAKPVPKDFMNILSKGFSCRMSVVYAGITYQVFLKNSAGDQYEISVEKPETLAGFIFKNDSSGLSINYKGLGTKISEESMPQSYFAQAIFGVLDNESKSDNTTYKIFTNRIELYGESAIGKYTVKLDRKTGKPVSISIPSILMTVQIRDFSLNNQT